MRTDHYPRQSITDLGRAANSIHQLTVQIDLDEGDSKALEGIIAKIDESVTAKRQSALESGGLPRRVKTAPRQTPHESLPGTKRRPLG